MCSTLIGVYFMADIISLNHRGIKKLSRIQLQSMN